MKSGNDRPVNSTAARVIARGDSFSYRALETEICSSLPLPVKDSDGILDLSGIRMGRLIVIGYYGSPRNRWVCKCICGNYCIRTAKAIKKSPVDSSCAQCYLQAVSRRNEYERRTGKRLDTVEFLK